MKTKPKKPKALWVNMDTGIKPNGPGFEVGAKQLNNIYNIAAHAFKVLYPLCACCLMEKSNRPRPTVDIHHRFGRSGALLMDVRNWLPCCRQHHQWIGDNPEAATVKGWLNMEGWRYAK